MPDLGKLVIAADLAIAIAGDQQRQGWLGGAVLSSETLYVALSASLSTGTKKTAALSRLKYHRAFQEGEASEDLLRWFRVDRELSNLLKAWTVVDRTTLSASLDHQLSDGIEYICSVEPTEKAPKVRAHCLLSKDSETRVLPLRVLVLYRAEPYQRLSKSSVDHLAPKKVAIVGTGSGGSDIAVQLASAGLGNLLVFDGERLGPENLFRHQLTRRDLGRQKVAGIVSNLAERDLPTKVTEYFTDVVEWANDFRSTLANERPDLIICATDSRESRRFVNYCAVKLGIPLVIAGILDDGRIGEIIHCVPHKHACYECVRIELGTALVPTLSDDRPSVPYVGGEAEDLQSGTYRFDVSIVSGLATRVALQELDPDTFPELPANYIVWGRERSEHETPFRFDFPLSLNYVPVPKRSDCPVCGEMPADLEGVDIDARSAAILAEADEIPA